MSRRVSILSAVKNEQDHLNEMIASVVAQTHANWELLIVSDGSTDRTEEIALEWSERDGRVQLAGRTDGTGKADAFNRAFTRSTGDLVVLLAGDDTLPLTSLEARVESLETCDPQVDRAVAFFKIRTFSDSKRHNGMTLPRGESASHSGGTITMTRNLADLVFPIDTRLVSEDLWLSRASEGTAGTIIENPAVVLNYRIHDGNSNPRNRPFSEMFESMTRRHLAWRYLMECDRLPLSATSVRELEQLSGLEALRNQRKTLALLTASGVPITDRLGFAAMSNPVLFWIRQRAFRLLSGRRRR